MDQDNISNKSIIEIFTVWVIIVDDFEIFLIFLGDGSYKIT